MQLSAESISKRIKLEISGIVQGVGFRPFVYQLAHKNSLCGFVLNNGNGVIIELEGTKRSIDIFLEVLNSDAPVLSRIDAITQSEMLLQNSKKFEILHSDASGISAMVSADISLCDDCKREMRDPQNRRYKYPFINCTNCGPRYTIVDSLPYDRKNSSMDKFEMCDKCRGEYEDPFNRRFHAQPISCYECGPRLKCVELIEKNHDQHENLVANFARLIAKGESVAIKGVGGFHIVCDATNEEAVKALRLHKHRPTKPLAVMFKNITAIKKVCTLTKEDESLILSKERPIVLVKKKKNTNIAQSIAPNIDGIGVFLPYTPLHELLLDTLNTPIVATSANLSDEPIIRDEKELFKKLPLVINSALSNDREILNACDDSVMMSVEGESIMLRLARGYAPKSFYSIKTNSKKILALGANQKSTITLAFDNHIILSPHIGDLNSLEAFEYFLRTLETFKRFYDFEPDLIVCDKHPNYETTKWAKDYVSLHPNIELVEVQHHYAHALACMAEFGLEEDALAFCFDGTGYGEDGSLWGGEVLKVSPKSFTREYHLKTFSLLGGEKAVKEPRRIALALLFEYYSLEEILEMKNELVSSFTVDQLNTYYLMYQKKINSPQSSSMGRLFDGIYALSGNLQEVGYEGESGLIIEKNSNQYTSNKSYTYTLKKDTIEFKEMIDEIVNEKDTSLMASKFLNTLRNIIIEISQKYPHLSVILSGGVFQNKTLLQKVIKVFKENGVKYYVQNKTPINDGGISFGQAYYATHMDD